MLNKLVAETLGSFIIVAAICASILLVAEFPPIFSGGVPGIALCVGFTAFATSYALAPVSDGHFNPAVTFGAWIAGYIGPLSGAFYCLAQLIGSVLGAAIISLVFSFAPDSQFQAFAANGFGEHSPAGFSLYGAALAEILASAFLVLGALRRLQGQHSKSTGSAIAGVSLAAVYIWLLPITGASVNPARSTASAVFGSGWALRQLWLFWCAPLIGAAMAGGIMRFLFTGAAQADKVAVEDEASWLDRQF
ncbi:MAG: aquaporin [Hyphomicrobiales bacterium]